MNPPPSPRSARASAPKQLGLAARRPLTTDPLEDGLLALATDVLLHQRQHLGARRLLRRQLRPRSASTAAFSSAARVKTSASRTLSAFDGEPRADRTGASLLEIVDHQPRRRLEHLGQPASPIWRPAR